MFSPYYAWARPDADPLAHCAFNVALYGDGPRRWTMTERGIRDVQRSPRALSIGPSSLRWSGDDLVATLDEIATPRFTRVQGHLRIVTPSLPSRGFQLDTAGRHRWQPIAPCARIEVVLTRPALRWSGHAYVDSNHGDEPLEHAFNDWDWSRVALPDSASAILYDARRRDATSLALALRCTPDGSIEPFEPPAVAALTRTRWGLDRNARGALPREVRALEDGPFYSRAVIETTLFDTPVTAMHERLSLIRFRKPWVRALLPFRMPRRAG